MYLKLIRNKPQGHAIRGRLIIDGRWFCNTLERVGYQIPALCYPVKVTMSPKFKRLLPLVCGVPLNSSSAAPEQRSPQRTGIRFHRGTKPQHSTGCILVVADNWRGVESFPAEKTTLPNTTQLLPNSTPPKGRTSADVEQELTNLLKQVQNNHEEIILEVFDFRPGTELGYNTPCPPELQKP